MVRLHLLVRFPYCLLGYRKRLCFFQRLLPSLVGLNQKLDDPEPSLRFHYRSFIATTLRSVPVPCFGTLILGVLHLDFSLGIRATGSHVPRISLCQIHAAFMPVAIWAVGRSPPDSSQVNDSPLVLTTSLRFRQVISGSLVFVSLTTSCRTYVKSSVCGYNSLHATDNYRFLAVPGIW
jgi:hypothetical protein